MKVPCPECPQSTEIKSVKPGRFKLKCAACGAEFGLQVDAGPPVKVTRFRLGASSGSKNDGAAARPATAADATMDAAPASRGGADQTMDAPASQRTASAQRSAATNATRADDGGATIDQGIRSKPTPKKTTPAVTAKAVTETMDSAVEGRTQNPNEATVDTSNLLSAPKVSAGASANQTAKSVNAASQVRAGGTKQPLAEKKNASTAIPERLGGYRIMKLLGQGAMGAVYQARQISLDRNVALKVIRAQWADSPTALVRFTREAYAAAQLTHHNVVQIYDFGEDHGQHFFSMEWVRGGPLSDLLKEKGKLDPRAAAGYILQAARGLQFAHRNGMVHRDVKPANLLLDEEGVVKVADLGLVKVPDAPDPVSGVGSAEVESGYGSGSQVTGAGSTVGTPAYMAPEQSEDAAMVDHRADIYSLGCSLFHLLTGQPPFSSKLVSEVLELHRKAPPPSLRSLDAKLPESLEKIVRRAMEKRVDERYANLGEMIADLEQFLGVQGAAAQLSPQQTETLENAAKAYNAAPLAAARVPIVGGGILLSLLVSTLLLFASPRWALGPLLMCGTAIVTYLIFAGMRGASPLATSLRGVLATARWTDWLTWIVGFCAIFAGFTIAGLLIVVVPSIILGVAAGVGYHLVIDGALAAQRRGHLTQVEQVLRDIRLSGTDEGQLRRWVARFAGKHWEELFAELFGYASVAAAREDLIRSNEHGSKARFWAWRDSLIARLDQRLENHRRAQEQAALAKVEKAGLQAEGLSAAEAEQKAWQMASAVMDAARQTPPADGQGASAQAMEQAAAMKRAKMKAMLADARSGNYKSRRKPGSMAWSFLVGGKPRFLLGCLLLAGFAYWVRVNNVVDTAALQQLSPDASADQLNATMKGLGSRLIAGGESVLGGWVQGLATLAAGLILLFSSLGGGLRMSIFAYPAAAVALLGTRFGIPALGPLSAELIAAAAGMALFVPGIFFGNARE